MIRIFIPKHKNPPLLATLLLFVSLACNALSGRSEPGSYPEQITIEKDITFGPGDFLFPDPKAGLSSLASYQAVLTITFSGTRDGEARAWSKTYAMYAMQGPEARVWNLERSENGSSLEPVFLAEMNGLNYEKRGQEDCSVDLIQEGNSLTERLELASFLIGVVGAEEAGGETINDMPATHYTFDQRALGKDGVTESNGELWVADDGGYLVKYLLTTKAGEEYFGEGTEGTLTFDYQLTAPNQPIEMILPEDCPPGLVNVPMLPDATNVENVPGNLSYDTKSSIADTAAYYQEQIPALGWTLQEQPAIMDTIAVLTYVQDDQLMLIIIKPGDSGVQVRITLTEMEEKPLE